MTKMNASLVRGCAISADTVYSLSPVIMHLWIISVPWLLSLSLLRERVARRAG